MSSSTLTIRIDDDLKRGASEVADYYGLDLSSVTRAFYKQMVNTRRIPLTFAPDEQVKYLVLTPKYSAKAEGDSVLIVSLQNPTAGVQVEENTLMANVVITDEDEPETVTLSMATPTITPPINMLPVSPMKILAGCRLKRRKPMQAPTSAKQAMAIT